MIGFQLGHKWLIGILAIILISQGIFITSSDITTEGSVHSRALSFTEASTGLPTAGGYNYVAFGDFNKDNDIDIAFGGENYGGGINTVGLYAYTGDGGSSWTDASSGLPTEYSWGGLQLADADSDGAMELYATDEHWGSSNNQGVKVFEYQGSTWLDSVLQATSPVITGTPNNVIIEDISGNDYLDMVVCLKNGIEHWQNIGGNPSGWSPFSVGLETSNEFTAAVVGDMNNDGLLDIVAADYSKNEYMYIQRPLATWQNFGQNITTSSTTLGTAIGDVNKDGHMDIIFGTRDNGLKYWLGNSGGGSGGTAFEWTTADTGLPTDGRYAQIQLVDIDADGDLDIIAPSATVNRGIEVYLGNGNTNPGNSITWTLALATGLAPDGDWYGANIYDINGDGALDIVGASWGDGISAWLNNPGPVIGDTTPPSTVTDLEVLETTEDSIKIQWSAPGDDGLSGTASQYDLRFAETPITGANWNEAIPLDNPPTPKAAGLKEIVNVSGLEQASTYYFGVISADEVPNWSPVSNSPSGITLGTAKPALKVAVTLEKSVVDPGEELDITVDVTSGDTGGPVSGASVDVGTDNADASVNPSAGLTDLNGRITIEITLPDVTETTKVVITVDVTKDGYKSSKKRITITVNPPASDNKQNLRITASDITHSPTSLEDGDEVTIFADISNSGKLDAGAFTVKIFIDGAQLGTDSQFTQLKSGVSVTVEQTWTATEGTHTIKIEITPTDTELESDALDNTASRSVTVHAAGSDADGDSGQGIWLWLLIIIIILIIAIAAFLLLRKKQKPMEVEEERIDNR